MCVCLEGGGFDAKGVGTHMEEEEEETVDANTKQDSATVKCGFAIIAQYP